MFVWIGASENNNERLSAGRFARRWGTPGEMKTNPPSGNSMRFELLPRPHHCAAAKRIDCSFM